MIKLRALSFITEHKEERIGAHRGDPFIVSSKKKKSDSTAPFE
jgi:hypothetical protein